MEIQDTMVQLIIVDANGNGGLIFIPKAGKFI